MKKWGLLPAVVLSLLVVAFIVPKHDILGRWLVSNNDGSKSIVDFRSDGGFSNAGMDGSVLNAGKFLFSDDIFSMNDGQCGADYWGKYKLTFYGSDSISVAVIQDSCTGRHRGVDGVRARRIKK